MHVSPLICCAPRLQATLDVDIPHKVRELIWVILRVKPEQRPSLQHLLDDPVIERHLARHGNVRDAFTGQHGRVASVEIPLIGYGGASKTKFSERCARP